MVLVRWSNLFDDLEAQLAAAGRAELEGEIAEHTRAERGSVSLLDRISADLGSPVRLELTGAGTIEGELAEVGTDWLAVRTGAGARVGQGPTDLALVPLAALLAVRGLTGRADPGRRGPRRLGLRNALRAISRDRVGVRVTDVAGGRRIGRIERVGLDHLDLTVLPDGGPDPESDVGGPWGRVVTLPYPAIAVVVGPGAGRD